ncbi:SEC-C metal-binding domain-containing protein [Shouchella patagoniensis]|uniref:SEC-C metal-binding domain-containing protein n=1 Tax=Shouchella patagoniensis TaxID=228576 RepID=UPI000994EBC2|nr:SEC-C metal-binding domain-containing protein [Shouchella patagoniensis]
MLKRNDPCHCGSGRKYKKCCMNNADQQPAVVSDELSQLETEMLYNAFTRYQKELTNWVQSYHHVYPDVEESVTETLSSMLLVWLIFHKPIDEEESTIFDVFIESKVKKLKRPKTIEIVQTWKGTRPAVLEVEQVEELVCTSIDLLSGDRYTHNIPKDHQETVQVGSTIIGFPAQSENHYAFIGPVISNIPEKTDKMKETIASFNHAQTNTAHYIKKWPQLLSALLAEDNHEAITVDQFNWDNDLQKETAECLLKGLRDDQQPPEIEILALQKWQAFATGQQPTIRKPEVFAAAIEYALQEFAPVSATQKALATKYGVSTSTISSRSNEILTALKDTAS